MKLPDFLRSPSALKGILIALAAAAAFWVLFWIFSGWVFVIALFVVCIIAALGAIYWAHRSAATNPWGK